MHRVRLAILLLFFNTWLISCSSADKKTDTPEAAYAVAEEYDKDERFEEALRRYADVKNKFPYSRYATMAELAMADVYYKQESFAEAQVAYQNFKDLHPKHPQTDYVTFRLAMSFFNQLPPTIDRDLTLANSAILYFDETIKQFPNSPSVAEAKEKRAATLKMLAEKEQYIADYYFKKEAWESALGRYEGLLKQFPNQGLDAHALSRATICAVKAGDQDRAKKLMAELNHRFPNSKEADEAKKEVQK